MQVDVDLALDTNVLVDVVSNHDLDEAGGGLVRAATASQPTPGRQYVRWQYRWERARVALALAWWLHRERRTSASLKHELWARVLSVKAKPGTVDGAHAWLFANFFKSAVVPSWFMGRCEDPAFDDVHLVSGQPGDGNRRDQLLVRMARHAEVPLVSWEEQPTGAIAREAAIAPAVTVVTPIKYLTNVKQDVDALLLELSAAFEPALIAFYLDERDRPDILADLEAYARVMRALMTCSSAPTL